MKPEDIINSNLKISIQDDESGRRYYSVRLVFSDEDILTVYRDNMKDLMTDLPNIISSAMQARIISEGMLTI
ncbi:MAG: hypothetical protein AB7W47_10170 [Calditrichaceae bacterium]